MEISIVLEESKTSGLGHEILAAVSLYLDEIKGSFEEWKEFYETIFPVEKCLEVTVERIKENLKQKFEEASKFHEEIDDYLKETIKVLYN